MRGAPKEKQIVGHGSGRHVQRSRLGSAIVGGVVVPVLVVALLSAGCGSSTPKVDGSSSRSATEVSLPRGQFIGHMDQVCLQFTTARQSLTTVAFGSPSVVEPSRDQQAAYFKELLGIIDAYVTSLSTLERPPDGGDLVDGAIADAVSGWLLLVEATTLYEQDDEAGFANAADRFAAHYQGERPIDDSLRAFGFNVCGELRPDPSIAATGSVT